MSAPINIKDIVDKAGLINFEFTAPDNKRVGSAPLLDNGLNLLYAPDSYGKSYTSIQIAKESGLPALFIDLESNGKTFTDYCKANGVAYVYAGSCENIFEEIKQLVREITKVYHKALIIIDSYSDIFPDDEGKMAQATQKNLGELHKFFMRDVECPALLLDHATEKIDNQLSKKKSYKIEGNKSGKFKKTVVVLRLDLIGGNIKNGTFVTVERSRNQDVLKVGHTQQYKRGEYLLDKIRSLIEKGKLPENFTVTDLKKCTSGDDRKLWNTEKDSIATLVEKDGNKEIWELTENGGNRKTGENNSSPDENPDTA